MPLSRKAAFIKNPDLKGQVFQDKANLTKQEVEVKLILLLMFLKPVNQP